MSQNYIQIFELPSIVKRKMLFKVSANSELNISPLVIVVTFKCAEWLNEIFENWNICQIT